MEEDERLSQEQMSSSCGSRQLVLGRGHAGTEDPAGREEVQGEERERELSTAPTTLLGEKPDPQLDMLFREAELIARNLKESGTRR